MSTDEIVTYIVNVIAPKYDNLHGKEKNIYHAIMQSLPTELIIEVKARLLKSGLLSYNLQSFIDWMQKKRNKKPEAPNESIKTLLRWYQDKKSNKVSYAYERLVKRFEAQSFRDKMLILRAFLLGGKKSSEWAATQLRHDWIPGLEVEIVLAWNAYRGSSMAKTIIYKLPEEYVMLKQDELIEAAYDPMTEMVSDIPSAYAILCGRLGRTAGFIIDETRLSILDWFYVVGKLCLIEKAHEMNAMADRYISSLNCEDYAGYKNTSGHTLLYCLGMSRIIWAMKCVHYTEGIIRLANLEQKVINAICPTDVNDLQIEIAAQELKKLINRERNND